MSVSFQDFSTAFPQFIPGGTASTSPYQSVSFPGGATNVAFSDIPGLKSELNRFGGQGIVPLLYLLEQGMLPGQASTQQSNIPLMGMSDADLLAQAQQLGIDVNQPQFQINANPVVNAFGQVPNVPFQFGDLSANSMLPPEVQQAVAQTFQSQRELGQQDLIQQALEAAGLRGLRPSDTPIAGPLTRAQALMESQLRGQEAGSLLNLGQQQRQFAEQANMNRFGALQQALGQRAGFFEGQRQFENQFGLAQQGQQQNLLMNLRNAQEQMRQQAFQNRLQLAQQLGQGAFSLGNSRLGFGGGQTTSVTQPQNLVNSFSPFITGLGQIGTSLGLGFPEY